MKLVEINKDPSPRDLRWFGLMFGAFLLILGAIFYWRFRQPGVARGLWIAALVVPAIYYAIPPVRKPLFVGWMYLTLPIGWVVSHVVLAAFYYLVLTPVGMFMRLVLKRDPMQRQFDRAIATYWITRDEQPAAQRYFRQF